MSKEEEQAVSHWAEIDENNIVLRVLVVDENLHNEGLDWLNERLGGTWVQTSYNTQGGVHLEGGEPLRKNYASVGFTYDEERDAFIPPQPFDSWTLNEETCLWEAPTPRTQDDTIWDEETLSWVEI